jgi:hypothetical protein
MNQQDIIDFIDRWLDEKSWNTDSRLQDFALDVRLMLGQLDSAPPERPLATQAA